MAEEEIPFDVVVNSAIEEMFGDLNPEPKLFLAKEVDETFPAQAQLVSHLECLIEQKNFKSPDKVAIQILGRLAGYQGPQDNERIGNWGMAFCLNQWQVFHQANQDFFVEAFNFSPLFEPRLTKEKIFRWPSVKANKTKHVLQSRGSRTFLKPKNYISIIIWMFWDDYPTVDTKKTDLSPLETMLKEKIVESFYL